jgi:prophage regulatory protein
MTYSHHGQSCLEHAESRSTVTLKLERLPAVKARVGLSTAEIYRRIAAKKFPAQIHLSARAVAFDSREIDLWILARIAESQQNAIAA